MAPHLEKPSTVMTTFLVQQMQLDEPEEDGEIVEGDVTQLD